MTPDPQRKNARTQFLLLASQVEFLDRLCTRVRRDSGCRLSKRTIIETLVETIPTSRIPLREVVSEDHLKDFLRENVGAEPETAEASAEWPVETGN